MNCAICTDLERAFEARRGEYIEALDAAIYRVSKKFAAYKNVDMERARNELEEHRSACALAARQSAMLPVVTLIRLRQQEGLWGDPRGAVHRTV
jgi:hypothetical protein